MRIIIAVISLCGLLSFPVLAGAETVSTESSVANAVSNIASAAENGNGEEAAEVELGKAALAAANGELDKVTDSILSTSNFTHLDVSLGGDSFGLDTGTKTKTEIIGTYRLRETKNGFLFNQGSVIDFNNRTTVNFGIGYRNINDAETVITGINVFYDYELDAKHRRAGAGVEWLTSLAEFRYNLYNAQTKTRLYDGINETALNGSDVKLTAKLPYLYDSDVYYRQAKWKEGSYKSTQKEWGLTAEIIPNVVLGLSRQKADSRKQKTLASLSYSVPLGGNSETPREMQDGSWSSNLVPIRNHLYRPVQRENRIMKKAMRLGVVVSGY